MKKKFYFFVKRIFDIMISLVGSVLLIFITPIIKVLFLITKDYDTIFYSQNRIGKNGKIFKLYKYRTMVMDADTILKDILKDNNLKKEWLLKQKLDKDPRITKVGRFLRISCLDEFPQFINVLRGEMSLIGPRPYLEREKKYLKSNLEKIVVVKPGITGYWQVNREKNTSFKSRIKFEKYYAENCNLLFDFKIFFETILLFFRNFIKKILNK